MSLAHVIVDEFTDTPLRGNQLAVFEDGSALSDDQMQRLAREMNLPGTVFLLPAIMRPPARVPRRASLDRYPLPPTLAAQGHGRMTVKNDLHHLLAPSWETVVSSHHLQHHRN
jgi:hypothetical protein